MTTLAWNCFTAKAGSGTTERWPKRIPSRCSANPANTARRWVATTVRPDLAKFHHFGKYSKIFFNIFKVYLVLGKVWHNLYAFGKIFIAVNGQILKTQSGHLVTLVGTKRTWLKNKCFILELWQKCIEPDVELRALVLCRNPAEKIGLLQARWQEVKSRWLPIQGTSLVRSVMVGGVEHDQICQLLVADVWKSQ